MVIIITVGNDQQFARVCEVLGKPELADDERYSTNSARVTNRAVCVIDFRLFKGQTSAYWLKYLEQTIFPVARSTASMVLTTHKLSRNISLR